VYQKYSGADPNSAVNPGPSSTARNDMVADLHHFNANPDLSFHFNADLDPDSHERDAKNKLRPVVYGLSTALF
jgi:hypothetical protein